MWIYNCPKIQNCGKIKSWNCIRSPRDTVETEKGQVYWLRSSESDNKRLGRQGGIGKGNKKNGQWYERKTKWVVVSWEPWFLICKCECLLVLKFWDSVIQYWVILHVIICSFEKINSECHISLSPVAEIRTFFWPWED